ncbi:hypothetical protein SLEP1_g57805 [Rubroshorea leprosula]|uniref:Uncharacterized protein n=1 Tax=Rubroshorea leprosula TaxID=152421 RepID=A0AAV5MQW7_9ROSI|nr:hypothetical protein SLEP1_g57805 [Rubroshorea leprosula]
MVSMCALKAGHGQIDSISEVIFHRKVKRISKRKGGVSNMDASL